MDNQDFYPEIIEHLRQGVYVVDTKRQIIFWNQRAETITGYTRDEVTGSFCQDNILQHISNSGISLCMSACPLFETLTDGKPRNAVVFLRHKAGHRIPVCIDVFPLYDKNGKICACLETFFPVSKQVYNDSLIDRLAKSCTTDELTGLPNRRALEECIRYKLLEQQRFQAGYCVLMADIDHFKLFNDTYGHIAGDEALRAISRSLGNYLPPKDQFGRWGGEEFVGIFSADSTNHAHEVCHTLRLLAKKTGIPIDGHNLHITISIGATMLNANDTNDSVVARADRLMYESKRTRNCVTTDF